MNVGQHSTVPVAVTVTVNPRVEYNTTWMAETCCITIRAEHSRIGSSLGLS